MELVRFPSRGGFSVRSIFTFVLTVLITALLWITFSGAPAHAATNATWTDGDVILFDNHGYNKATDITDTTGTIPSGATVYKSSVQTSGAATSSRIFIIYFSSGVDPPTATSAKYVEFDYSSGKVSNPQNAQDITLTPQGSDDSLAGEVNSSCSVGGIGWIICPVSVFLAESMDNLFKILSGMIAVQPPVLGDENNSMYVAWNIMRTIANVAFVIVFLIIIYSQLTNMGVSNYGLKKLVPRLIIAAVLVNVSFYVAALAIDISNIAGYSIQNIFNGIRESIFHLTDDEISGFNTNGWGTITSVILAGGGLIGGVYYMATGGLYLLIPLLLGLGLTVLFVVIVFAARQAIILILVIIAPLAFVANLLPNTEKWFDKWKDLFMTMLIFFPAFSLVFGGSQLAGQIIIQNAGDNIVSLLFGMAVQIAPLVITPLLLKLSGGLLGRIAQIANNPKKGLLDRNKNWANARAEHAKQKNMALGPRWKNPASAGAGMVRRMDYRKRRLNDKTEAYKQAATNRYEETPKYSKIHELKSGFDIDKNAIHDEHAAHIEHLKVTHGSSLYQRAQRAEASKDNAAGAQNVTNAHFNRQRQIAGTALNASSNYLEYSKMTLESSENEKTVYQMNQKLTTGTLLNSAVDRLETGKTRVERKQSQYSAMVDTMKLDNRTALHSAALGAQSAKELQEAAQNKLQTYFDQQRSTAGTGLNLSTITLENSKSVAERAKADLTQYVIDQKVRSGGALRTETLNLEGAKIKQQISETQLTKMAEEFRSGKIDPATLTAPEQALMDTMKLDAITLSAEKQAVNSAQYEVQRSFADAMTGTGPLTDAMLDIAQGVGGETARVRAQSQAVKAARSLDTDALSANVELLKNEAQRAGTNIKRHSAGLVEAYEKGLPMYDGQFITPERLKAALQAQAEEKNIPLFERIKGNSRFDQAMVNEIVALNNTNFKVAGGFGLQDDPTLNIDNFNSEDEYWHALRAQRISNLANTNAAGIASLKFGWVANSLTDPKEMKMNIEAALLDAALGDKPGATEADKKTAAAAKANLQAAYRTVHDALLNEDIRATMNDRETFVRSLEAELATIHGRKPLPSEPLELKVDAATYPSTAPSAKVDQDLTDSIGDADDVPDEN